MSRKVGQSAVGRTRRCKRRQSSEWEAVWEVLCVLWPGSQLKVDGEYRGGKGDIRALAGSLGQMIYDQQKIDSDSQENKRERRKRQLTGPLFLGD